MKRLWLLSFLVVFAITMVVSGCTSGSNKNTEQNQQSQATKEPVKLKVLFGGDGEKKELLVDKFNKENKDNITVEADFISVDNYADTIRTRIAANDLPDMYTVYPGNYIAEWSKDNGLLALNDMTNVIETYKEGTLDIFTYEGNVYGFPRASQALLTVYNKKIFSDLGLSVPKTWPELMETAQKIKDNGIIPFAMGGGTSWLIPLIPYTIAPSAVYADSDWEQKKKNKEVTFADSGWKSVMEKLMEIIDKGYFNVNAMSASFEQSEEMVARGEAAMIINGQWVYEDIIKINADADLGGFPVPAIDSANEPLIVPTNVSDAVGISGKTKHPEAAKAYLTYLVSLPTVEAINTGSSASPLKASNYPISPAMDQFNELTNGLGTYTFLNNFWPAGFAEDFVSITSELMLGNLTVDKALKELDTLYDRRLAQN